MTLVAGLLYQEAPQQLCSVYLADEQRQAGQAVVLWAVVGLAAWLWRVAREACRAEASVPAATRPRPLLVHEA